MKTGSLFPARLLGFGFYWAWLFLVGVSPSPVFEDAAIASVPFEMVELAARTFFVVVIFACAPILEKPHGDRILLVISFIGGPLATVSLALAPGSIVTVILTGMVDASMFMLWLCFFGRMKVGETAQYMALSYSVGAIICIAIGRFQTFDIAVATTALLPVLSGITFVLSVKLYPETSGINYPRVPVLQAMSFSDTPYLRNMTLTLGICAFMFGLSTSVNIFNDLSGPIAGPLIEAPCSLVLGLLLAIIFQSPRSHQLLYGIYRLVPLILAFGFTFMLFDGQAAHLASSVCVMLGYLVFEILSLNDYQNIVKEKQISPIKPFAIARFAISTGMLIGWLCGFFVSNLVDGFTPIIITGSIGFIAITASFNLIFTGKEVLAVRNIADRQKEIEDTSNHKFEEERLESDILDFCGNWNLSLRETEVLKLLLKGRNTHYIADQLFIATGTVKTHAYNIYRKLDIHTKMELLDLFEDYRRKSPHGDSKS